MANGEQLESHEFIHPSVRIRYLYNGNGLDDTDEWCCPALTKNEYSLTKMAPPRLRRPFPEDVATREYEVLLGKLLPYFDTPNSNDGTPVRTNRPPVNDLHELDDSRVEWFWANNTETLAEEQVGMWELLFMRINQNMLQDEINGSRILSWRSFIAGSWIGRWIGWLRIPAKNLPEEYDSNYGFHNIVSWQSGDPGGDSHI